MTGKRHRWMAFVPFELTEEDGLRMIGALATPGADLPDTQLAADERPAVGDERPFMGLHNMVRELVTVGCFDCEQPMTPALAGTSCPGEPSAGAEPFVGTNVAAGLGGIGRNDACPCGSGRKYKRCHGVR